MPDNLSVGKMDLYLTAQVKTETKSVKGQVVAVWADSFKFFASHSDTKIAESLVAKMTVAPVTVVFSTWYRPDITRKLRIYDGTDHYLVTEITRNKIYMDITCNRIEE